LHFYSQPPPLYLTNGTDDFAELNNYICDGAFPFALKLRTAEQKGNAFDAIMQYFIANFGESVNLTKIVKDLNKKGVKLKIETANRYIEALENAKILIRCDRFDMKSRKALMGEKNITSLTFLSISLSAQTTKSITGRCLKTSYIITHLPAIAS